MTRRMGIKLKKSSSLILVFFLLASTLMNFAPLPVMSESQPGGLVIRVHNLPGYDLSWPGTVTVFLWYGNYERHIGEKSAHFSGGEPYVSVSFSDLSPGDYVYEVYQKPDVGLRLTEFWGGGFAKVEAGKTQYIDFYRHTQWITSITVNGQPPSERITVKPGEKVSTGVTIKNEEERSISAKARVVIDRDLKEPYDYDRTSEALTISRKGSITFSLPEYYPTEPGTYYIYVVAQGLYSNWAITDQRVWSKAFTVPPILNGEITSLVLNPTEAKPGDIVRITATVKNTGTVYANYHVYTSANSILGYISGTIGLNPGQNGVVNLEGRIPGGASPGTYSIDVMFEMAKQGDPWTNTKKAGSVKLTVLGPQPGYIKVTIINKDDDPIDVSLYIDGTWKLSAFSRPPGSSYASDPISVQGNANHEVKIVWQDPDTAQQYEKSQTVYVPSGQTIDVTLTVDPHGPPPVKKPDLRVRDITLSPYRSGNRYYEGENVTIFPTIINEGSADATNFVVNFYVDNNLIKSWPGWSLKQGEEISSFGVTYIRVVKGTHKITVVVDPDNRIDELDETDNSMSVTIYVEAANPDLTALSVTASPSQVNIGGQLTVTWTEKNQGNADSGNLITRIYLAKTTQGTDYKIGETASHTLKTGESKQYTTTVTIPTNIPQGEYYVTVYVDPDNKISESNENNNIGSTTPNKITVKSTNIVLEVTDLSTDKSEYALGEFITFRFKVRNVGNVEVTFLPVRKIKAPSGEEATYGPTGITPEKATLRPVEEKDFSSTVSVYSLYNTFGPGKYEWGVILVDDNSGTIRYADTCYVKSFNIIKGTAPPPTFEVKIVDCSFPQGIYKPGSKVVTTFSVKEISGKVDAEVLPRMVIVDPAGKSSVITGKPIVVKAGTTVSSSLEWLVPDDAPAGTYSIILSIDNGYGNILDRKAKDFAFVIDKGVSYIEVEPFYPPWGMAKGIHIHIAAKDMEVSGPFGTVINIRDKGIGKVIGLLSFAKIVVGGLISGVPTCLSLLATAQDVATLQNALKTNPDGSVDFLFLEVAANVGYFYMGAGLVDVGTPRLPDSLAHVPLPKGIELPYYAELRFPIEFIAQTLLKGYNYLVETVGYIPPKVTVIWGEKIPLLESTRYYKLGFTYIDGPDGWDADIILHEYGHFIMDRVYGGLQNPDYGPDNTHYWDSKENPYVAWIEGWASFFACAVQNDRIIQYLQVDLESQEPKGESVEGAVACALWDIFDGTNDGLDTVSLGFSPIWKVVTNYKPTSAREFYIGWKEIIKDYTYQIAMIFKDHGIIVSAIMNVKPATWSESIESGKSKSQTFTVYASDSAIKGVTVAKISGPNWITISPTNLGDVQAGTSKTFIVTASPPAGISGEFQYTVRVSCGEGEPRSVDVTGTIRVQGQPPTLPGDLNGNGKLDTGDATVLLRRVVGLEPTSPDELRIGDMNGNGVLDTGDATLILRKVVGLE